MKHLLPTLLLCFLGLFCRPQNPAKSSGSRSGAEKPPTQAELQEMMKEFQNLSEEDKKMLEQMGIKIPDMKDIPNMNMQDLAGAWEDENRLVPVRDNRRIASIPKKISGAEIGNYVRNIQGKLAEVLEPETIEVARASAQYFQGLTQDREEMGNMAMGLFIAGKPKLALFTLGELLSSDPQIENNSNDNHLSNYAAMLSMMDGQHLAIPILNYLNTKEKGNSTLLNNLGQAWFGLGDIAKASTYLDSVLVLFPDHAQATLTKATIEESKGNTVKTRELIRRSLREGYSREKEELLEKMGEQLTLKDVYVPFKPGPDPLGLSKIHRPDYPTSLSELRRLKPLWENFNKECSERIDKLQNEYEDRNEQYSRDLTKLSNSAMKYRTQGNLVIPVYTLPLYAKKASLAMQDAKKYHDDKMAWLTDQFLILAADLETIKQNHRRAVPEAPCEAHVAAENDFLEKYNERKKAYDEEALKIIKHYLNEMGFWSQFTSMDENQYELIRLEFLIEWLQRNLEYQPLLNSEYIEMECIESEDEPITQLAEFDLVACKYKSKLDLKVIKIESNCSRMTSTLDLDFIEYTRYDNFERAIGDEYERCTLKVKAGKELGSKNYGPLKAELKAGVGLEIEMDRDGIQDVTATGSVKMEVEVSALDGTIKDSKDIKIEGKISLLSGHGSVTASTSTEGIKGITILQR